MRTDFLEELSERMTIREGSREVTLSKQRVLMKSLMSGALKGSPAAIKSVLELAFRFAELSEEEPQDAAALTQDEREVVDLLLQRLEGATAGDQASVSKDEGGDGESV